MVTSSTAIIKLHHHLHTEQTFSSFI